MNHNYALEACKQHDKDKWVKFIRSQSVEFRDKPITNYYACDHCDTDWEDEWDCACDDRCPECNTSITPYYSADIDDSPDEIERTNAYRALEHRQPDAEITDRLQELLAYCRAQDQTDIYIDLQSLIVKELKR